MIKNKIETCIIPAAGKGSRWAPVSGYLPKEMLPLYDRPVIEWVVKEAIASGCKQIVVIKNRQKKIIQTYLTSQKELTKKTKLVFVDQDEPLGIAHAMYLARGIVADNPFLVALPDLPTISRQPVVKQLISAFEKLPQESKAHIVSFDKFSSKSAYFYGECLIRQKSKSMLAIQHFCPKQTDPKKPHHNNNFVRMSGRFIFTQEIFGVIKELLSKKLVDEISDRSALRAAHEHGHEVWGFKIQGHTYDTGYPEGYVRANTAFFKKLARKRGVIV